MNMAAQAAIDRLIDEGLNYKLSGDDDELIEMVFDGDNIEDLYVGCLFAEDEEDFLLFVKNYCTVPEDKKRSVLTVLNSLNNEFRWVKFYLDEDGEVCVEADGIIDSETCGEVFFTMLSRLIDICDQAYLELMDHIRRM